MSSAFSLDLICNQEKNPIIYLRCVQLCTQHLIIHLYRIRTNWENSFIVECSFIPIDIVDKHIKSYFPQITYVIGKIGATSYVLLIHQSIEGAGVHKF